MVNFDVYWNEILQSMAPLINAGLTLITLGYYGYQMHSSSYSHHNSETEYTWPYHITRAPDVSSYPSIHIIMYYDTCNWMAASFVQTKAI